MSQSHPTPEYLAGYASGTLSDGLSLLVGAHLTYCPACRRRVAEYETISGAFLDRAAPATAAPSLGETLARIDAAKPDSGPANDVAEDLPFPAPIRRELARGGEEIRWRFRLPGVHEHALTGFEGESVSLLRVRPGRAMPHHTHEGDEATLILSGAMEDDGAVFRRGDVAVADHNHDHQPRVIGEETCYCLVVLTGNMRFTGPVSRALNIFSR